jgi:acyl carrier protein
VTGADRIHQKVVALVSALGRDARSLRNDEVLLRTGLLDSAAILELLVWIEEEFSIELDQDDISVDNFGTIDQIVEYLNRRQESGC